MAYGIPDDEQLPDVEAFPDALARVVATLVLGHEINPLRALVTARSFALALTDLEGQAHHRAILNAVLRGDVDQASAEIGRYLGVEMEEE